MRGFFFAFFALAVLLYAAVPAVAQTVFTEVNNEHDPVKRADMALSIAEISFDHAKQAYVDGQIEKGDAQLENMTSALNICVQSLETAHKAKFYKKAELRVAYLQRRMQGLVDDIELSRRGWAEYTERKLEEIHDKLLEGVMRK
jgi:hypothetical protein